MYRDDKGKPTRGLVEESAVVHAFSRQLGGAFQHSQGDLLRDISAFIAIHLVLSHIALSWTSMFDNKTFRCSKAKGTDLHVVQSQLSLSFLSSL